MHKFNLKNPVSELTLEIVRDIQNTTKPLGVELLLVGAQAKVIWLENIHGLNSGRATGDIDFAFVAESWEQYEQIKQSLIATSQFREDSKTKHRLAYKSSLIEHEYIVDIIPFGAVQDENQRIAWPPDLDVVMSVSGYQEAFDSSLMVELDNAVSIKVVSLAGLAILKIFAWSERGNTTENKDAIDLFTLLRAYYEAGNVDRVYAEFVALESFSFDPQITGAWLLGRDVATIANEETIKAITVLIDSKKESLELQMAKSIAGDDNALDIAAAFLSSFAKGLLRQL